MRRQGEGRKWRYDRKTHPKRGDVPQARGHVKTRSGEGRKRRDDREARAMREIRSANEAQNRVRWLKLRLLGGGPACKPSAAALPPRSAAKNLHPLDTSLGAATPGPPPPRSPGGEAQSPPAASKVSRSSRYGRGSTRISWAACSRHSCSGRMARRRVGAAMPEHQLCDIRRPRQLDAPA